MTKPAVTEIFALGIHPRLAPVEKKLLDALKNDFYAWRSKKKDHTASIKGDGKSTEFIQTLIEFIKDRIRKEQLRITTAQKRYAEFTRRYNGAAMESERRQHILDFAKDLGATSRQLAGDRRAFSRWFGYDVVVERYHHQHIETERRLTFYLNRLGAWSHSLLCDEREEDRSRQQYWRRLELERHLTPLLSYEGDSRVRIATFRCLATALSAMPDRLREDSVTETTLQSIYRFSLERRQEVWIQCEALSLLPRLSRAALIKVLPRRLSEPSSGDDLFVRRHAVKLICENLKHHPALAKLLPIIRLDPNSSVRQALANELNKAPHKNIKESIVYLACIDDAPQVRAAAVLQLGNLIVSKELIKLSERILGQVLENERDSFCLRVALKVAQDIHLSLVQKDALDDAQSWFDAIAPKVDNVNLRAEKLEVRRWAAQAREHLWCQSSPARLKLRDALIEALRNVAPGKTGRLRKALLKQHSEETLGRVLSLIAQADYGLELSHGIFESKLKRGHAFGFRSWRLWHEMRNGATDKRQGFRHTTGRIFHGTVHAPSAIMAELAETRVPGEPLFMASEQGWRPYLPLLDEIISSLDQGITATPVRCYTSEGITEIVPPRSLIKRFVARTALTRRFSYYAQLRNWHEGDQTQPNAYLRELRRLGIEVAHRPYTRGGEGLPNVDTTVQRFFPVAIPWSETDLWARMESYFVSVYENSLSQLAVFLTAITALFVGKHLYFNRAIRRVRNRLPLVLGGWGTRGKSGTERLKAALMNALGYSVVSKTTGCEAMFLYAPPYGKLREMFLFRPYDKATIWEQAAIMRLADRLQSEVFLWECMALTPSFVSVLQDEWVRDDIATITNTYPDHEDLQGPAGINIPEVMTNFIPKSSVLLTTEEQMLPILVTAAENRGTRTRSVGWLEAGLLCPDILARFPYEEHPYNIALVLTLADELGVSSDFALKEMADRVVLDLGVLKAYPVATLRGRRLEFINGMSANERFGCLNNWQRMGFADHDYEKNPGTWLTTLVNNRADRIARSQVFANILVNDLSADRHFLIGTNMDGLVNYIRNAWERFVHDLTLWPNAQPAEDHDAEELLADWAWRFRVPFKEQHVKGRLEAMLTDQLDRAALTRVLELWHTPESVEHEFERLRLTHKEEIVSYYKEGFNAYSEYCELSKQVSLATEEDRSKLNQGFREQLWRWFERKLIIISDPYLSGDEIVNKICEITPPGFHNRMMGMQNIKGTGLDFVYRWQAWEACYDACQDLRAGLGQTDQDQRRASDKIINTLKKGARGDTRRAQEGLRALANYREYGFLCEEYVSETIDVVKNALFAQKESFQAELRIIESNLKSAMEQTRAKTRSGARQGFITVLATAIEGFLDAGDAVKRRKFADRIYKDLANQRITHERAALELQKLIKRQKGGWLAKRLSAFVDLLSAGNARKKTDDSAPTPETDTGKKRRNRDSAFDNTN